MSKFAYEGTTNPGDGSRHPIGKKLKKWAYNAKVNLLQDKDVELSSVRKVGRALK